MHRTTYRGTLTLEQARSMNPAELRAARADG